MRMRKFHWFAFAVYGVLAIFMGIMAHVTYTAFSRKSGSTGQDIVQIQKIRYDAFQSTKNNHTKP